MRIINLRQVREKTSLSGPTIWRKERAGEFPPRRKLTTNRVGWVETEVDSWLEGCSSFPQTIIIKKKIRALEAAAKPRGK